MIDPADLYKNEMGKGKLSEKSEGTIAVVNAANRRKLPRSPWPANWNKFQDPVVPLERNLYGHPSAGLLV